MDFSILGKTVREPSKVLETFPAPPNVHTVTMTSDEVTSLCPVTGQPDWDIVTVEYTPRELCIESKSFKLYLWSFREEGAFCESLADIICQDVFMAALPYWCGVTVEQKPRGGVSIVAQAAKYLREDEEE